MNNKENKTEQDWKKELNDEQYKLLREKGTEISGTGKYLNEKSKGIYNCAGCDTKLFMSDTKFDSGTGWPSFDDAIKGSIKEKKDSSYGMNRIEIVCAGCESHLGHKFDDGITEKGTRYCINSTCLNLKKE